MAATQAELNDAVADAQRALADAKAEVTRAQQATIDAQTAQIAAEGAKRALENTINTQPRAQLLTSAEEFSGRDDENFDQFVTALNSSLTLAGIPNAQKHNYLRLKLKGSALIFYDRLPNTDRNDYANAITKLRDHYENPQHREIRGIEFDARNFEEGKETPREFLDALRLLAVKSFPEVERESRIRDRFVKGMPNKLKKKLLNAPTATSADDLVELLNKKLAIDKACPPDENLNAFNELNQTLQAQMSTALEELNKTRREIKSAQEELTSQVSSFNKNNNQNNRNSTNQSGNRNWNQGPRGQINQGRNRNQNQRQNGQNYQQLQQGWQQPPLKGWQQPPQQGWQNPQNYGYFPQQVDYSFAQIPAQQTQQALDPNAASFVPGNQSGGYQNFGNQQSNIRPRKNIYCYNCNGIGHLQRDCPSRPQPQRGTQIPYPELQKN